MTNSRNQKITPTTEKTFSQEDSLGVSQVPARRDHTHGTQDNPVDAHTAEADPHPQYFRLDQQVPQEIFGGLAITEGFVFNTSPYTTSGDTGTIRWNATEDTIDIFATNQTIQVGQEISPLYKNQSGVAISNGMPCMFAGAVGASGRLKIQKAIADGSLEAKYIIGVATEDIANGDDGHVTWFGKVRGLDTSGTPYGEVWNDGDILYVSPITAGFLTNVKPNAPDLQITVAAVVNAHATVGTLFVRPTFLQSMTDLNDVDGTPLTTTGQFLVWDNGNQYFDPNYNILTFLAAYIAGTANKITVTDDGDGSITLTLPAVLNVDQITPAGRLILPMGEISYFDITGTTIAIASTSDGSTNMVKCDPTTALSGDSYEFDNGGANDGRLRYTGTTTKQFHTACTISVDPDAANDTFVFGVAKNGTVIASSKVLVQITGAGEVKSTAMHVMVELATNDYLELYVGNITDADDVVIHTLNLFAMGM